jgi:hypothetical protein
MFRKGDMIGFYRTGGTHFFDLEHSSWETGGGTNKEYRTHVATARIGKNIYYIGGKSYTEGGGVKTLGDTTYLSLVEVFNTETFMLDIAS